MHLMCRVRVSLGDALVSLLGLILCLMEASKVAPFESFNKINFSSYKFTILKVLNL